MMMMMMMMINHPFWHHPLGQCHCEVRLGAKLLGSNIDATSWNDPWPKHQETHQEVLNAWQNMMLHQQINHQEFQTSQILKNSHVLKELYMYTMTSMYIYVYIVYIVYTYDRLWKKHLNLKSSGNRGNPQLYARWPLGKRPLRQGQRCWRTLGASKQFSLIQRNPWRTQITEDLPMWSLVHGKNM